MQIILAIFLIVVTSVILLNLLGAMSVMLQKINPILWYLASFSTALLLWYVASIMNALDIAFWSSIIAGGNLLYKNARITSITDEMYKEIASGIDEMTGVKNYTSNLKLGVWVFLAGSFVGWVVFFGEIQTI